jgi:hypothetical protein
MSKRKSQPSEDGVVADTGNSFNAPPRSPICYRLDAGRLIVRDGEPFAMLHGVRPYDSVELDAFAREVVTVLNTAPALLAALRALHDACEYWDNQNDPVLADARAAIAYAKGSH